MKNFIPPALALAAVLIVAPFAFAQTPAVPPAAQAEPAPVPATPTPAAPPVQPNASQPASQPTAALQTCRTRKQAGEACACLSAPDRIGVVEAGSGGGRNMCVVHATPPTQ